MTSWNGRQFGKYSVHEEIGRGGMARVFRATDRALQRQVALKILAPQLASDAESSQRFAREAITAANLRHPNIITIFDVGEVDDLPYIAMEYIAGRTLQAVIDEQGAMGLGYAVALLAPVADALDYAHQQHAVHRDIKPHNIMLNVDGRIVLTDFGIAQAPLAGNQRLTRSGMFMGTPEYIAPEQAAGKPVDGRSDLYSLAIVAFEIITGNVPFHGSIPELLVAHAYNQPPLITTLVPSLPRSVDTVFERALAKNAADRPPSAHALIDALRTLAVRSGITIPERDELRALAVAQDSSAGKQTIAMNAVSPAATAPSRSNPQAPTDVGAVHVPTKPVPQPAPRRATPRPQPTQPAKPAPQRPAMQPAQRANPVPRRNVRRDVPVGRATTSDPVKTLFPFALALMLVVLGVVFWQRSGTNRIVTPVPTRGTGLTGTGVEIATATRIETTIPTDTPEPTATEEVLPTDAPTDTTEPEAPTNTPPPTRTPRPPTAVPPTSVPPTSVPPTDVPPTVQPTDVPPTEQPTTELPTVTPEPPIATTQTLPEPTLEIPPYPSPTP